MTKNESIMHAKSLSMGRSYLIYAVDMRREPYDSPMYPYTVVADYDIDHFGIDDNQILAVYRDGERIA